MLTIEIEPTKIRSVRVTAQNDLEQDVSLLLWPLIRPYVEKIDRRLRKDGTALLRKIAPGPREEEGSLR